VKIKELNSRFTVKLETMKVSRVGHFISIAVSDPRNRKV
jgi:hypothetical protein